MMDERQAQARRPSTQELRTELSKALRRAAELQSLVINELSVTGEAAIERAERAERSLRAKEAMIDASVAGLAVWDIGGRISYVNPAFLAMWGYDRPSEVEGRNLRALLADDEKATAIASSVQQLGGWIGKLKTIGEDGSLFTVMLSASPIRDSEKTPTAVVGSFVEMTYRERLNQMLFRQADWLRLFHDIDLSILSGDELTEIARTALTAVLELTPCTRCSVTLFERRHAEARLLAAAPDGGVPSSPGGDSVSVAGFGETLATLQQEGICWFEPHKHLPLPAAALGLDESTESEALALVSLAFKEELLGSLNVRLEQDARLTNPDETILQQVADALAVAVRHARLAATAETAE